MACQPQISADNRKYVSQYFPNTDPYYSTIQAAINSIMDASPTKTYAVYVYPGDYHELITLKSYVSIIGSGIQSTAIKGDGTGPVVTGTTDSGGSGCYVVGLSIDGHGQPCLNFPVSSSTAETSFLFDLYLYTSQSSAQPAVIVRDNQVLHAFNIHCINQSTKFNEGVLVTGTGQLRLHNSQIAYTSSYGIDHQSTAYTEAYNSFIVGGAACYCSAGTVNLYLCQTVGKIEAHNSAVIKPIDSFHANQIISNDSSTIWISGLGWAEEGGNDITITLNGSSKIVLANSRAKVINNGLNVVTVNSTTATFKAINSVIVNKGNGYTITGVSNVTVYLYYCVLNTAPASTVTIVGQIVPTPTQAE